jgi:hypothetical protein
MPYCDCREHATDKDAEDNQQYSTHIIIIHLAPLGINFKGKDAADLDCYPETGFTVLAISLRKAINSYA